MKKNVLFLCTGNSCRSQMAEGWLRHLKGDQYNAFSAGIETHGLNPHAIKVMAEAGVDISGHRSQLLSEFEDQTLDFVFTVCGHAHENCPVFLGEAKVIHVGFDDHRRWLWRLRAMRPSWLVTGRCGMRFGILLRGLKAF